MSRPTVVRTYSPTWPEGVRCYRVRLDLWVDEATVKALGAELRLGPRATLGLLRARLARTLERRLWVAVQVEGRSRIKQLRFSFFNLFPKAYRSRARLCTRFTEAPRPMTDPMTPEEMAERLASFMGETMGIEREGRRAEEAGAASPDAASPPQGSDTPATAHKHRSTAGGER